MCTVNEDRMPNNWSRFFFLPLPQVSLFDLTRLMLLEVCEGASRHKESTLCELVTKDLSSFLK